jgi:PTS system nitrogen regulatory IIA component
MLAKTGSMHRRSEPAPADRSPWGIRLSALRAAPLVRRTKPRDVWSIMARLSARQFGAEGRRSFHASHMNRLAKLLPPGNIALDVSVTSKKRVFEQAGLLFENNHGVARAVVTDNLFARESLGSTGLGAGVAIPHGRIKGLKQPLAAFMRLSEPVPFESPDGKPVSLLIFLLVPEQATQQHLEILSEIAQLLSDRDMREGLATLPSPEAIHQLLTDWRP